MKKLISLLLVICILCPLLVGCGNRDEDFKMKKAYLRQFEIEGKNPEDVIIDYDGGEYNGARIVMLDVEWHDPEEWTETVDGVEIKYYDSNRLYAYKNGKFFTLTDAYDKNKLSREDIVAVGEKFNQQVTAYIDTCDKWDFDSCENIEFGNDHLDYYNRIVCHQSVWLRIDNKISPNASDDNIDTQKLIEYINSNVGMDLISPKPIGMFGYDPYWKCLVGEFILKNVTMENLYTIMEKLSLVPGIKHIACHCLYVSIATQAANDEYYSDYQWGLDSIEIEKVWDFTSETSFFLDKYWTL